jgi:hypothetical protein
MACHYVDPDGDPPATFHAVHHAPSAYKDPAMRPWNTVRATVYGGAIGLAAAAVKSFAPWSDASSGAVIAKELIGATLAFALLCGLVAALRNFIQRRLRGAEFK